MRRRASRPKTGRLVRWPFVLVAAFAPAIFLAAVAPRSVLTMSAINTNANANAPIPPVVPGLYQPGHPAVTRLSPTKLLIVISPGGNTAGTLYSIQDTVSGRYVLPDGTFGAAPVYRTFLDWGLESGTVVDVKPNTHYGFVVTAKNPT